MPFLDWIGKDIIVAHHQDVPVHDGRVDFVYNDNTAELSGIFEDTDLDFLIESLNDGIKH